MFGFLTPIVLVSHTHNYSELCLDQLSEITRQFPRRKIKCFKKEKGNVQTCRFSPTSTNFIEDIFLTR